MKIILILISYLTAFIANAMQEPEKPKGLVLFEAISFFENENYEESFRLFNPAYQSGGFIAHAYVTHMIKNKMIKENPIIKKEIPQIGIDLGKIYLDASLAYMDKNNEKKFNKLCLLVNNNNIHAASLMYSLWDKIEKHPETLKKLKN
jgi:hypothetical protein